MPMKSEFDKLCQDLNLNPNSPSAKAMTALKHWYLQEVSQDQYVDVDLNSARDYLDVFLPNIPANKAEKLPVFHDMNAIQYAAANGYDRFLENLGSDDVELFNQATANTHMTPLHLAARYGHVHVVEVCLKYGADPHRKDSSSQYPIQSALFTPLLVDKNYHQRKEIIFNLLKSAAPDLMKAQDIVGDTVAHKIAANGYPNLMKEIISDCPDVLFITDNFMQYPIHVAILNNRQEIVQMLLKVKDIPHLTNTKGELALHYAARSNNIAILNTTLPFYSNLESRNEYNQTPLLCAAEVGNLPAMIILIQHHADTHATDYRHFSLLHHAIYSSHIKIADWILENLDLDVNLKDTSGHSALYYAEKKGFDDLAKRLIEKGAYKEAQTVLKQ
jgi:ankyrin repeat protein